jgi:hypothetical protein
VRDENGVIHTANIIWGNSVKPALGDALEIVLVATGFEGENEDVNSAMERIVTSPIVEPVKTQQVEEKPALEPIKPVQPKQPQRPQEPAVLGARSNRYDKIGQILAKPAYQARNAQFAVAYCNEDMMPQVPNGTILLLQKVNPQALVYGNEYVVVTSQWTALRRVRLAEQESELLLLANDPSNYDNMTVRRADILAVFDVRGKLILKNN